MGVRETTAVEVIRQRCMRFYLFAHALHDRKRQRPPFTIEDEYDVQDAIYALLSQGGGSSRMDFLLKKEMIVVEAKMTRSGLRDKEVYNELVVDAAKYLEHPDCRTLVCYVHDPGRRIKNPRGLESDIAKLSREKLQVIAIVGEG